MTRILVVDDDPMVCMAIDVLLQRHGFEVIVTDGGEAGLRALDRGGIDLMIVDIFMPHMRGFESIRIFHERAPAIPMVAMSGYAFANLNAPAPDFPADGARARRVALSAQAVHAGGAAHGDQRVSCRDAGEHAEPRADDAMTPRDRGAVCE